MKINSIRLFLLNYFFLIILELSFKFLILETYDIGILYIILFTLPIALVITLLSSLFKKRIINKVISIILWILMYALFVAETVYFSFYKTICGVSALMYGGQVMEFFSSIMVHVKSHLWLFGILLIPLLILLFLSFTNKIVYDHFKFKDFSLLFIVMALMNISVLEYKKLDSDSSYYLFYKTNDLMQGTNRFGIISSVMLDAVKVFSNFTEVVEITNRLPFTKDENTEYNVTNIDFDSLIAKEKDSTLKTMHNYFKTNLITEKNKYTGMFAGKNLIFITAEAFYPIGVDPVYTPTLYKLVNNGFVFNNYYQPIYNCSTSDGEFVNSLSLLPGVSTCSMDETHKTYLPYTLGNMFKNYDYDTYAFHGWTYTYYDRDTTYPNMGYTYYGYDRYKRGYKYALKGIKDSWPTSDIDVANSSYEILKNSDKFVAYYMSISGHLEYNFSGGNYIAKKNKNLVKDYKGTDKMKAYLATQIELDKSLQILMEKLESDGILDDTVIVLGSDHYPYGLSNNDIKNHVDWMKNSNFDLYKNNLIIYNSEMEKVEVNKYASSIDILPTVLNLFGVEYDSRLLMGTDLLSDSDGLVIFNNKSWITEKGRYDYLKKKFEPFTDEEVDKEYISQINEIVKLKFQMSKLIINKNYYKKVLGG